jgi:collagenase-like protein with putative collagen-binding domain/uncharacterized protein DUF6298
MTEPWDTRARPLSFLLTLVTFFASVGGGAGDTVTSSGGNPPPPQLTVSIASPAPNTTAFRNVVSKTAIPRANTVDRAGEPGVQFQVDGDDAGSPIAAAPYSYSSWDTAAAISGSHTIAAVARDGAGNQATMNSSDEAPLADAAGPLVQSATNPNYFVVKGTTKAVLLSGSHTWDNVQDTGKGASPVTFDFDGYVSFLKAHGHNATILWHQDLPAYCHWDAGDNGVWQMVPWPWQRNGPGNASDGKPKFDLTKFNQAYFDRLRARVIQLRQNGIYAIVQLFDGYGLIYERCGTAAPAGDGYPFTGVNNVNGIDDGYTSGATGDASMTMTGTNPITAYQDAYVRKVIDTLSDQPSVLWEISEEAPVDSSWWQGHMISLIHAYEAGKPFQHPVGFPTLDLNHGGADSTLYDSDADWVAPRKRISPPTSCGRGTPKCKVNINDGDHSYFGLWNESAQNNRNYVWENFTEGNTVLFMDFYHVHSVSAQNSCAKPIRNGICSSVDTQWDNLRDNLGWMLIYANTKLDLIKMTPQSNLSSTGFCLANNMNVGGEFLVYAPAGGGFTVDLSAQRGRTLNVQWLDPASGRITNSGTAGGGNRSQSFAPPWGRAHDAVLYLVDTVGHN